jgi:hypothetical protein
MLIAVAEFQSVLSEIAAICTCAVVALSDCRFAEKAGVVTGLKLPREVSSVLI